MDDLGQLWDSVSDALRTFGAEFTSVWLPIQIAMLLLAAAIAYGGAALIRKHIHFASLMAGLPYVIRQLVLALTINLQFIIFALVTGLMHTTVQEVTATPARSYLIYVAASLATAGIVISLLAALLRNHFVNRIVAISLGRLRR
jgi:hypothetical protein